MTSLERAIALYTDGQYQAALALAASQLPDLLDVAATCAYGLGMRDEAERYWRIAVAIQPGFQRGLNNLGLLCAGRGSLSEAEAAFRQALAIQPDYVEAQHNLAAVLAKQGRTEDAIGLCRQSLAIRPNHAETWLNLGSLLNESGLLDEAEYAYRQALRSSPGHIEASLNLAFLLLSEGRYSAAWPLHELRYHPARASRNSVPPLLPIPQWQGEDLTGKRLLVWHEQGFGDEIQFCRLVPRLKAQAAWVGWVCKPPLADLLKTLVGLDAVYPVDAPPDFSGYDYWTFPLSIPLHCGLTLANLPAHLPYLHPLPERLARWQPLLPVGCIRVGLVWRGYGGHGNDARRSLAGLALLRPLWSIPGVAFISLQKEGGELEALSPPPGQALLALGGGIKDFADTAAIIAQLDLLICVDTAVAHLAGALGKPCWVLLPEGQPDWRWLLGREDSPWYPGLMRLFRHGLAESWEPVIGRVASSLREWVEGELQLRGVSVTQARGRLLAAQGVEEHPQAPYSQHQDREQFKQSHAAQVELQARQHTEDQG